MDALQKIAVKLFLEDGPPEPEALIRVFHRFIREGTVDGLLIDVADYSHVHHGPGVLLVAHEGNYGLDAAGGHQGVLYTRKQPQEGELADRVIGAARHALQMAVALESAPELGQLSVRGDLVRVIANDRLHATNPDGEHDLLAATRPLGQRLWPGVSVEAKRDADPPERLSVMLRVDAGADVQTLLCRLSATGA